MNYLNKEHEEKYLKLKKEIGFKNDRGEYASFAYLVSTLPINITIDNFMDIDKSRLSNSEVIILDLAKSLFTSSSFDINKLRHFDSNNFKMALNAINIRFML